MLAEGWIGYNGIKQWQYLMYFDQSMTVQNKGTWARWPGDARLSCRKRDGVKCRQAIGRGQGDDHRNLSDHVIDDNSTITMFCKT
jgi:hypothetical protein